MKSQFSLKQQQHIPHAGLNKSIYIYIYTAVYILHGEKNKKIQNESKRGEGGLHEDRCPVFRILNMKPYFARLCADTRTTPRLSFSPSSLSLSSILDLFLLYDYSAQLPRIHSLYSFIWLFRHSCCGYQHLGCITV